MGGRIGLLGGLSIVSSDHLPEPKMDGSVSVSSGFLTSDFRDKRLFSTGSVKIGSLSLDNVKIFWDIGAKVTIVYVPNIDMIGMKKVGSFAVTALDAGVMADIFPATIDLSGGIKASLHVGVIPAAAEEPSFDSTDIILGMDVIEKGSLRIDGPNHKWSFKTK